MVTFDIFLEDILFIGFVYRPTLQCSFLFQMIDSLTIDRSVSYCFFYSFAPFMMERPSCCMSCMEHLLRIWTHLCMANSWITCLSILVDPWHSFCNSIFIESLLALACFCHCLYHFLKIVLWLHCGNQYPIFDCLCISSFKLVFSLLVLKWFVWRCFGGYIV